MEQPITRITFSLGSKLLLSVLSLLLLVIFFLNFFTIVLLKRDKVAYTYQMQSVEAQMMGVEFKSLVSKSIETLKTALGSFNPKQPLNASQVTAIDALVKNQTLVSVLTIKFVDRTSAKPFTLITVQDEGSVKKLKLAPEDWNPPQSWFKSHMEEILTNGFLFFNVSKVGAPVMGVLVADLSLKDHPQGIPISIGWISLDKISGDLVSNEISIVDRNAWSLYDSDSDLMYSHKNLKKDPLIEAARTSQVQNGALEFMLGSEKFLGSYVKLDYGITITSKTLQKKALKGTYDLSERLILLGIVAIGAGILFSILFAKQLTGPLTRLYKATGEIASGNFALNLAVNSRDEIGALSSSFNVMSQKIRQLIASSVANVMIENELAIASTVQQTLFPPSSIDDERSSIRSYYESAATCGGDWWGYIQTPTTMTVLIADATGHGFPSALITSAARSCFSVLERLSSRAPELVSSPSEMLSYANRSVYESAKGKIMMTFFAGTIDFAQGTLTYASAGHNPPWLFKKEGEEFQIESLMARGERCGERPEAKKFEEKTVNFAVGDILFLYTDGLIEGKNSAGEEYGKKRARNLLERMAAAGPEAMIKSVMADFKQHNGAKALDDDITLAAIQVKSNG